MGDTAAIRADGLTKRYGPARGIESVDLQVAPGDVFGFLGPNGAGKTTLLHLARLRGLGPFTVWCWYDGQRPLTDGIDVVGMGVLIVLSVIVVVIGIAAFERRDVRE